MKNAREVRLKLSFAALCLGVGFVLLNTQGGLAGSSIPAYVESIDHAVAPVVTGRIAEVKVKLGEAVKAGQVLLTLEDRAVRLEHERVESELAQLEADLAAQESIQKGQLVEGVLRSSSALADESAARSEADSLKVELERVEKLRAEKLVDAATETAVRREYLAAAARVKVFERRRTQLPELYAARGPNQMQAQTDARVQPFREALKAKRASLAELDWQLAQYEVRAPVDGIVALLAHPIGDVVAAGTEVVRVVRGRPGHLVATVPEERARGLTPGLALTVRASRGLLSQKLVGRVVEVGPSVEQLPVRSWLSPQWPRWGRRAVIQVEGEVQWQGGERLYVQF
ncbi:MAG: HlyD family efflux transporter periplasmic adaptor subunit [Archangium sp.]|nr:HlyD family efflux transporter periplasmic adaptor subunit [Archangium sp.]